MVRLFPHCVSTGGGGLMVDSGPGATDAVSRVWSGESAMGRKACPLCLGGSLVVGYADGEI